MIIELIRAFSLIFFAEMGDKSQILAMTFATKYKMRDVLIGITVGIFFNHAIAVLLGATLTELFNIEHLSLLSGIVFILFGFFSLQLTEDVEDVKKNKYGPIITVSLALFLGELGDKTQLSAIVLASEATYPLIILLGTVSAMILTSLLGIYVGIRFGAKIPEFTLKIVSSMIFVFFGVSKVFTSMSTFDVSLVPIVIVGMVLLVLYIVLLTRFHRTYQSIERTSYQKRAEELKNFYLYIKDKLDDICLGEKVCKTCQKSFCLLGYTKNIVSRVQNHQKVDVEDITKKIVKDFDQNKVEEALRYTISVLKDNWNQEEYQVLHEIRRNFEIILYNQSVEASNYNEYKKQSLI